jgi:hypothetical protein
MPEGRAARVACALNDSGAFRRIAACIEQLGTRAALLTQTEILAAGPARGFRALVYDLEPGDALAAAFVRRVRAARPGWPIWLYYAPRPAVIERVAEVARLRGVWATAQGDTALHAAEVRVHLRTLVSFLPCAQLLAILDNVFGAGPMELRRFLEAALEALARGDATGSNVGGGAASILSSRRHLERTCKAANLPRPKRLPDHLTLLLIALTTFAFDVPLASAAEQVGLSPQNLRALCHRVLGDGTRWAMLDPSAQFEFALMALAKAYKAPQQALAGAADEVLGKLLVS